MNAIAKMVAIIVTCTLILFLIQPSGIALWITLVTMGITCVILAGTMYSIRWIFRS